MNKFKINIYTTQTNEDILPPATELALRSNPGYVTTGETDICLEALSQTCKIQTQVVNQLSSGDIIYENDGVTPFNGSGLYYNVVLQIWTEIEGSRICLISSDGIITIQSTCL